MRDADALKATLQKRRATQTHAPNEKVRARLDIEEHTIDGCPVYIVTPRGKTPDHFIYYLHGGAYVFEIIPPHWTFVADFAEQMNATLMVPIYPLAPEHTVLDALSFADKAYRLFEKHAAGQPVHMMGDSAGGGMATALVQQYLTAGEAMPANLILISPWFDVALDSLEVAKIDKVDPWLAPGGLQEAGRLYAGDLEITDPRVSPIHGPLAGLPPTHIFIGTRDILLPDCKTFAAKLSDAGVRMSYTQAEGMFHCWVLLSTREGLAARADIESIITRR